MLMRIFFFFKWTGILLNICWEDMDIWYKHFLHLLIWSCNLQAHCINLLFDFAFTDSTTVYTPLTSQNKGKMIETINVDKDCNN